MGVSRVCPRGPSLLTYQVHTRITTGSWCARLYSNSMYERPLRLRIEKPCIPLLERGNLPSQAISDFRSPSWLACTRRWTTRSSTARKEHIQKAAQQLEGTCSQVLVRIVRFQSYVFIVGPILITEVPSAREARIDRVSMGRSTPK